MKYFIFLTLTWISLSGHSIQEAPDKGWDKIINSVNNTQFRVAFCANLNSQLGSELEETKSKLDGTQSMLGQANKNLTDCIFSKDKCETEKLGFKKQVDSCKTDLKSTGARLEENESKLKNALESLEKLESRLNETNEKLSVSIADVAKWKDLAEKRNILIDKINSTTDESKREIKFLEEALETARNDQNQTRAKLARVEKQVTLCREATRKCSESLKQHHQENILKTELIANLTIEANQTQIELNQITIDLNQTRFELTNKKVRLFEAEKAKREIQGRFTECNKEIVSKEGLISELKSKQNRTMVDRDQIRINLDQAMTDMQMKSNTIDQLNQTIAGCESRLSLIELEKVDLVDGKNACVKNVSMLKAIVNAIKNHVN